MLVDHRPAAHLGAPVEMTAHRDHRLDEAIDALAHHLDREAGGVLDRRLRGLRVGQRADHRALPLLGLALLERVEHLAPHRAGRAAADRAVVHLGHRHDLGRGVAEPDLVGGEQLVEQLLPRAD